jgi:hypothetical protein
VTSRSLSSACVLRRTGRRDFPANDRLESAVMPNIRYDVYEPDERGEALQFAFGKELVPA